MENLINVKEKRRIASSKRIASAFEQEIKYKNKFITDHFSLRVVAVI